MAKTLESTRDPYPYPMYENDNSFQGGVFQQKEAYGMGEHLLGQRDPWVRLNKTPTLASARREVFYYDPQSPNDSLDFCIKAQFNQHDDLFRTNADVRVQKETLGNPEGKPNQRRRLKGKDLIADNFNTNNANENINEGRVLKNKEVVVVQPPPELGHPIKYAEQKQKRSKHQTKGQISGHHGENTNAGYARKTCGGFFN